LNRAIYFDEKFSFMNPPVKFCKDRCIEAPFYTPWRSAGVRAIFCAKNQLQALLERGVFPALLLSYKKAAKLCPDENNRASLCGI
jgi:hypothetical protein